MRQPHRLLAGLAFLVVVGACSPGAEAPAPAPEEAREQPAPTASQSAEPAANRSAAAVATAAPTPTAAATGARRCGWLHNPTPANWWLVDSEGQWILGTQGSDQADGMHDMPDMSAGEWVETNGHYGYGCACMTITSDAATGRVTRISDAQPKPLAQCRNDKKLPDPAAG